MIKIDKDKIEECHELYEQILRLKGCKQERLLRKNPKSIDNIINDLIHKRIDSELSQHIYAVIILMKASSNWNIFYRLLQRALPRKENVLTK